MSSRLREFHRSPVYVHSKLMVVDDEYVIIGSANINQVRRYKVKKLYVFLNLLFQRSLAGTRDTEMAVGCWQPCTEETGDRAAVYDYRRAIWTALFK